jgi:hypothetical protein
MALLTLSDLQNYKPTQDTPETPQKEASFTPQSAPTSSLGDGTRKRGPFARFLEGIMEDNSLQSRKSQVILDKYFKRHPEEKAAYDEEYNKHLKNSDFFKSASQIGKLEQSYIDKANRERGKPEEVSIGEALDVPFTGTIAASGAVAPGATALRVGAFSLLDRFVHARERLPKNTPLWLKDLTEAGAFIAEGGIVEGGIRSVKKAATPIKPGDVKVSLPVSAEGGQSLGPVGNQYPQLLTGNQGDIRVSGETIVPTGPLQGVLEQPATGPEPKPIPRSAEQPTPRTGTVQPKIKLTSAQAPQPLPLTNLPSANTEGKKYAMYNVKGEPVNLDQPELAKPPDQPSVLYQGDKIRFYNMKGEEETGFIARKITNSPEANIPVVDSQGKGVIVKPDRVLSYMEDTALPTKLLEPLLSRYGKTTVLSKMITEGDIDGKDFLRKISWGIRKTIIGKEESEKDTYQLAQLNRMGLDEYVKEMTSKVAEALMERKITKGYNPEYGSLDNWLGKMIQGQVKTTMIESAKPPEARRLTRTEKEYMGKVTPENLKATAQELVRTLGRRPTMDEIAMKIGIGWKINPETGEKLSPGQVLTEYANLKSIGSQTSLESPGMAKTAQSTEADVRMGDIIPGKSGRKKPIYGSESGQLNVRMVVDTMQEIAKISGTPVRNSFREILRVVSPSSLVSRDALDILMTAKGKYEKYLFFADRATRKIEKMWEAQPEKDRLDFIVKVQKGEAVPEAFQDLSQFYRDRLNALYTALHEYKNIPFLEHYFPQFWKDPAKVERDFVPGIMGRRPLGGTESFKHQRIFQTIKDGMDKGFQPISTNPETLVKLYEHNVRKFIMAQEIKQMYTEKGLWKFVRSGEAPPEGFNKINDKIAHVYFPKDVAMVTIEGSPSRRMVEAGEYYAPENLARVINNFLSKDLLMDTTAGRGLLNMKNALNGWQLGFSAFHFTFETIDSATSRTASALSAMQHGKYGEALYRAVTAPTAFISYFKSGKRFFDNPETQSFVDEMFQGGASFRDRQYYKNSIYDTWLNDIRSKKYGAVFGKSLVAIPEMTMRWLFEYYIPRLKVGAWMDHHEQQMRFNEAKLSSGEMTHAELARKTWANIENRMGELNYDNLFWHRTFKTAMMLEFRAVGWQVGKFRELGGAFVDDLPKQLANLRTGKGFEFTPKMNYTLSLLLMTGSIGAIYHYLHTGKQPETAMDYFYPKNGSKDEYGNDVRVALPTQLKDIYMETNHPYRSVMNKVAPEFNFVVQLLQNRDFYGDMVYNENDNGGTIFKQVAKYIIGQFSPISVRNISSLKRGESTGPEQLDESMFGITKAPQELQRNPAQQRLFELLQEQHGVKGPRTPEKKAEDELKAQARRELRKGDFTTYKELIKLGILPTAESQYMFRKSVNSPPLVKLYQMLHRREKEEFLMKAKAEGLL